MEHLKNPRIISRDQKCMSSPETVSAPRNRQGKKLRDILLSDKPNLSYADFHHEITRSPDDALPSQQRQVLDRRISKEDELIRYMSNLPSYLEKGKNFQDKGLNVGVLDWRRLEQWRCSQKQLPTKQNGCSPASSTTSLFSTDGSSTYSSRGLSSSPSCQRFHRLSRQSPLEASPKEALVQDAKSSLGRGQSCSPAHQRTHPPVYQSNPQKVCARGRTSLDHEVFDGNAQKFQDSTVSVGNSLSRQQRFLGGVKPCERQKSDLKSGSEIGAGQTSDKYEVAAPWKGKSKVHNMESADKTTRLQETKSNAAIQDCSGKEKSGAVIMPRDQSEHGLSSMAAMANFIVDGRLSVDPCQKSFLGRNNCEAQLPSNDDHRQHLQPSESCSQRPDGVKSSSQQSNTLLHSAKRDHYSSKSSAQGSKGAPQASHMSSFPGRMFSSPSKRRNAEERMPVGGPRTAVAVKSSEELDARKSLESVPKARNASPIRRLSFAMGKMIKNAGSRENSPHRSRPNSKECVARSVSEGIATAVSLDNPCTDKLSTNSNNNRGRSSPLRRLLDPLLKPRASSSSEPSKKHSSHIGTINSCNEPIDFCLGHSVKVNSKPASGTTAGTSDSHHHSQNGWPLLQALLQVSFKNGLPLFTFAIDNESNILAATVRKSCVPGKDHHSWTYTFFTIREVKKRSGIWLNQGGKGDGHGYIPNVVAQMKVSDSIGSFNKHNVADCSITREFGLFAVDVGHGDQYATDFHPTNDLAAIIIKLPRNAARNDSKDNQSSYNWLDFPQESRENLQETRSADSGGYLQYQHSGTSMNLTTTVILPGGVHTVPSKGEISTLAERWRSGGSCDCGGWDLGCQLRVYTNQKEHQRKMGPSGISLNKDKFQIFSQGNQDNQPILSLAPFKDRIYSVEFSSSLSLLQTFAICISYIDCRRPPELFGPSSVIEKLTNEAGVFDVAMQTKTSNQGEAPARYVSYPPHSPVGRV